jgi:hypothetical protein
MDRFRTFQIASGIFLAAYVLGHMNSVFVFARLYLGIDSYCAFATGAPSGLVKDAWNIRLVPHYGLGVFFVLSHLTAGVRLIMLSHGVARRYADRFLVGSTTAAGFVAFCHHVRHVRRQTWLRCTLIRDRARRLRARDGDYKGILRLSRKVEIDLTGGD